MKVFFIFTFFFFFFSVPSFESGKKFVFFENEREKEEREREKREKRGESCKKKRSFPKKRRERRARNFGGGVQKSALSRSKKILTTYNKKLCS